MELDVISYSLGEGEKRELNKLIDKFCKKAEPNTVILFDKAGRVLSFRGEKLSEIEAEFIASIMSAVFFASEELGNIVDKEDFLNELIYETKKRLYLISRLEKNFLVGVISSKERNLGSVRLFFKHFVQDLNNFISNIKEVEKQIIKISPKEIENKLKEVLSEG